MTVIESLFVGAAVIALSGLPAVCLGRTRAGQWLSTLVLIAGCVVCLGGSARFCVGASPGVVEFASPLMIGKLRFTVDAISIVFLVPIQIVGIAAAVYGLGYWPWREHPHDGRKLTFFLGLLLAAMTVLVTARDGIGFLFAWEVMAISGFLLISTEDSDPEVRRAGWLSLAASHFATLCLFGMFALFAVGGAGFAFGSLATMPPAITTSIFVLALLGFGTKAGLMPLHIWLPSAHAMAPAHVSALLSGVVIKMGIYGLVRVLSFWPQPPLWWGTLLLALGTTSAILGMAFALAQHDLKRILAYSSVENIGLIVAGIGLAVVGRTLEQPLWVMFGLCGALLHVWNHALFKPLLFFSAGSVLHACHTRRIDRLGGLGRRMPWTAACFLVGAMAACALPPLNGLVSEMLIYLGLFFSLGRGEVEGWPAVSFAASLLALAGGLAAACFARAYGIVFLGAPRTEAVEQAHESSWLMKAPMLVLALGCVAIGVAPRLPIEAVNAAVTAWEPAMLVTGVADYEAVRWISIVAGALVGLSALIAAWYAWQRRTHPTASTLTWDCGYAAPTARMQYTGSSFSEILTKMFAWALRSRVRLQRPSGLFPTHGRFECETPDTVLSRVVVPTADALTRVFARFRVFQQGNMQAYLLYIVTIVILLLMWR